MSIIELTPINLAHAGRFILHPDNPVWRNYSALWGNTAEELTQTVIECGGRIVGEETRDGQIVILVSFV